MVAKAQDRKSASQADLEIKFKIKDLFDSCVHYGHRSSFWNPMMKPYIFRKENGVCIIDLAKSYRGLVSAMLELHRAGSSHKRILFVGTKPQCSKLIKQYAIECGQYYVNHKWLGGMLTNWGTMKYLAKKLDRYEKQIAQDSDKYTKKELMLMTKQVEKLEKVIGGIRNLTHRPDYVVVIDTNTNQLAIKEAEKIGAKIIAVVDTNASPKGVDIVIPGNDDSMRSVEFYLKNCSEAILQGIKRGLMSAPSGGGSPNSQESFQVR